MNKLAWKCLCFWNILTHECSMKHLRKSKHLLTVLFGVRKPDFSSSCFTSISSNSIAITLESHLISDVLSLLLRYFIDNFPYHRVATTKLHVFRLYYNLMSDMSRKQPACAAWDKTDAFGTLAVNEILELHFHHKITSLPPLFSA